MSDPELLEVAKLVPAGMTWTVGTGTKGSHAQILPGSYPGRRHSFYATAATEVKALRLAAQEARNWAIERGARLARYG